MSDTDYATFIAVRGRDKIARPKCEPWSGDTRYLAPHQVDLVRWSTGIGKSAVFADTGLGKTRISLTWAKHVTKGGPVLIVCPLAVAPQIVAEGQVVGVEVHHVRSQPEEPVGIYVTNYDRLHLFDASAWHGVVLDESSCVKHDTSKRRAQLGAFLAHVPRVLSCTATPAPNDLEELGGQAEILGVCSGPEMLSTWFVNDTKEGTWRLKGHAVKGFWTWVASWGAFVRSPRDLGHDATSYELPPITVRQHVVEAAAPDGFLFPDASTLMDRKKARKDGISARAQVAAELVARGGQWLVWCDLNAEEESFTGLVSDAVAVRGNDDADDKEERLMAFAGGSSRVLVTKPKIAGWGLNFQGCHQMIFLGITESYEAYYQAIRRCWRFGQRSPVEVHVISSAAEGSVLCDLDRKSRLAESVWAHATKATADAVRGAKVVGIYSAYEPKKSMEVASWMCA